jgi:hypothetical protein
LDEKISKMYADTDRLIQEDKIKTAVELNKLENRKQESLKRAEELGKKRQPLEEEARKADEAVKEQMRKLGWKIK